MDGRIGEHKLPVVNETAHVVVMRMREEDISNLTGADVDGRQALDKFAAIAWTEEVAGPGVHQYDMSRVPKQEGVDGCLYRVGKERIAQECVRLRVGGAVEQNMQVLWNRAVRERGDLYVTNSEGVVTRSLKSALRTVDRSLSPSRKRKAAQAKGKKNLFHDGVCFLMVGSGGV